MLTPEQVEALKKRMAKVWVSTVREAIARGLKKRPAQRKGSAR